MELEHPQLTTFKYKHGSPVPLTTGRKLFFAVTLMLAAGVSYLDFPDGLVVFVIPFFVFIGRGRFLRLGPRYLVCGDDIVYFANVTQITLQQGEGKLHLKTSSGKSFTLDRDKFPTGARKAAKIAINKAAKFDKVSAKIIDKIRRASPALAGLPEARA